MDPAVSFPYGDSLDAMPASLAQKRVCTFSFNDEGKCARVSPGLRDPVLSALGIGRAAIGHVKLGCEKRRIIPTFCRSDFDKNPHVSSPVIDKVYCLNQKSCGLRGQAGFI